MYIDGARWSHDEQWKSCCFYGARAPQCQCCIRSTDAY